MSAYKDLVQAMKSYNVRCTASLNCEDVYDMRWSVDVALEDPLSDGYQYIADIQFLTWFGYKQGVIFYKQGLTGDKVVIPENSTLTDEFVAFFDNLPATPTP